MRRLLLLLLEFSLLFVAIPLLIYYRLVPNLPIPCLLLGAPFGDFAFTIGLGQFFHHGSRA